MTCDLCSNKSGTFDLRRLCCAARLTDSMPSREAMLSQGRYLVRKYGHDPKALSTEVKRIQRERLERTLDQQSAR